MKTSTAYNHSCRLKSQVNSIYSMAIIMQSPHDDILARLRERVYSDPAWPKLPAWAQQAVTAESDYHFHFIQRNLLVWAFLVPGKQPRLYDQLSQQEKEKHAHLSNNDPAYGGAHFWLKEEKLCSRIWENVGESESGNLVFQKRMVLTDKKF